MVDRLIGVRGEGAAGEAEALVGVGAGAGREDARGDSCERAGGGAAAVVFEQELVFECVDDRSDSLADPADRWLWPVGLVGAAGPQEQRAQFVYRRLEVGAGEALVADDRRALDRVRLQQCECCFTFGAVGGDEVDVDDPSDDERDQADGTVAGEGPLRRLGHSKDHRPDLPQVVIGLAVTREGIPVRVWVWPGNANDQTLVEQVKADLAGWRLGRAIYGCVRFSV